MTLKLYRYSSALVSAYRIRDSCVNVQRSALSKTTSCFPGVPQKCIEGFIALAKYAGAFAPGAPGSLVYK